LRSARRLVDDELPGFGCVLRDCEGSWGALEVVANVSAHRDRDVAVGSAAGPAVPSPAPAFCALGSVMANGAPRLCSRATQRASGDCTSRRSRAPATARKGGRLQLRARQMRGRLRAGSERGLGQTFVTPPGPARPRIAASAPAWTVRGWRRPARGRRLDLAHLHVGQPYGPRRATLDDAAAEAPAQPERHVRPVARL
jgi:hypothetical protein